MMMCLYYSATAIDKLKIEIISEMCIVLKIQGNYDNTVVSLTQGHSSFIKKVAL